MFALIGADGFFGAYIQKYLLSAGICEKILAFNHRADIFSDEKIINCRFELQKTEDIQKARRLLSRYDDGNIKIIYLAAVHNPDMIKKNPQNAFNINCLCYERFLREIGSLQIHRLIYASSDTVYGGNKGEKPFDESSPASPLNEYGRQKLAAEEITLKHGFTAARLPYMSAPSLSPYKKHFFDEIVQRLKNGEEVRMLRDFVRSSLSYNTAAALLCRVLYSDFNRGIINIAADAPTSKYDIGLKIAEYAAAEKSLVIPAESGDLGIFSEKRAEFIIMSNSLLKNLLNETKKIELCYED